MFFFYNPNEVVSDIYICNACGTEYYSNRKQGGGSKKMPDNYNAKLKSLFYQAKQEFVLDASDDPGFLWFYSSWRGMQKICETLGVDIQEIHHLVHHALCVSNGEFDLILKDLRQEMETMVLPKMPEKTWWHSDYEPVFGESDIKERAYEIFKGQFKTTFPGKRLGTKFAKEKWEEVEDKAKELATAALQAAYDSWKEREDGRQEKYIRCLVQWQESCSIINKTKESIQKILGQNQDEIN